MIHSGRGVWTRIRLLPLAKGEPEADSRNPWRSSKLKPPRHAPPADERRNCYQVDVELLLSAQAVAVVGARGPAVLPAARFVRVIQPDAEARAQGLTEERLAPDEPIGDVLLATTGVWLVVLC